MASLGPEINGINDTVNNINNTVGTLIELNQDENATSQIYEAFYDFEFRLQLELEKNHNRLANLENLFEKTSESLKNLNEKSIHLEELDKLGKLTNIPKMLETFRNQLFTEIQQTEQRTNRIKEVIDDMVIQLESVFNMKMEQLQDSIGIEISDINDKVDSLIESNQNNLNPELNQKINSILEIETKTSESVYTLGKQIQESNNILKDQVQESNSMLKDQLGKEFNRLDSKIEQAKKESKIDDELRGIFEHLLLQVGQQAEDSQTNQEKLTKKVEDFEMDLQMTLKDMDRRINKINSMIRNVYKALDSITDLITENSRSNLKSGTDKTRKTSLTKTKLKDSLDLSDDEDDEI